jgi:hypothetical protein
MNDPEDAELGLTRQDAIDALCEHFANDALSVEEFESRVDQAHKAESTEELRKLLQDPPSGDLPIRREEVSPAHPPRAKASIPSSRVKERGLIVAALGGVERKGRWIPARRSYTVAVMGGLSLDFREALLPPGETEVWIFALMGGAEIIVPPGLSVESDGIAIMGGFEHREEAVVRDDPDAPVLRLRGFALMGGVEVAIRYPGESGRDAKRRLKELRREQRRLRRGKG